MSASDDAALVAAALLGGPQAFVPIVERYQDAVFGVALARVGSFHDAQDVAQAVFVEAFQRLDGLKDPAKLGSWLRKMAIHRSLDLLRQRRALADVDSVPEPPARDEAPRRELREEVLAAIAKLGKLQGEAVTLFYINGYSMAEVAAICDVPVAKVKSRLHEGRQRLKEEMVAMVEDVLKSESPKDDFAQRVFEAITGRLGWWERHAILKEAGGRGLAGFFRAMESPKWQHRRTALQFGMLLNDPQNLETIIERLKQALTDRNKKVRGAALADLMTLQVPQERRIREFVPLVVPMLKDVSARVRRGAAFQLREYGEHVPMELAAHALLNERYPPKRWPMHVLLERAAGQR